jgi:transcriptional regulator with XRE-family HTH domain
MSLMTEGDLFADRLKTALARFNPPGRTGVAWIAREFNQRYDGKPISVNAARKWLNGEAIPTHDKLMTLACWLRVSPEWLLFGAGETGTATVVRQDAAAYRLDAELCRDIAALNSEHKHIVRELLTVLLRLEGRDVP